jgi:SAM-dependent methyltransferase
LGQLIDKLVWDQLKQLIGIALMNIKNFFFKNIFIVMIACLSLSSHAQYNTKYGDERYEPRLGQSGKDVIWLPTSTDLVTLMLRTAKVTSNDIVYDLGAGDGKIAIAAAKDFGAKAFGVEFNPEMASLAQRNADRAGVGERVKIINGDIFKEDFSSATVLTLYLLPELNLQLKPIILNMKPGTRIVSNTFHMGDWEPDVEIGNPTRAYYWVVPAKIAGTWGVYGVHPTQKATLQLVQYQQRVGGTLTIDQTTYPIMKPNLEGEKLKFSFQDKDQLIHDIELNMTGDVASGLDRFDYKTSKLVGKKEK